MRGAPPVSPVRWPSCGGNLARPRPDRSRLTSAVLWICRRTNTHRVCIGVMNMGVARSMV